MLAPRRGPAVARSWWRSPGMRSRGERISIRDVTISKWGSCPSARTALWSVSLPAGPLRLYREEISAVSAAALRRDIELCSAGAAAGRRRVDIGKRKGIE
jgi:hypothetical protein